MKTFLLDLVNSFKRRPQSKESIGGICWTDFPPTDDHFTKLAKRDLAFRIVSNQYPKELNIFNLIIDDILDQGINRLPQNRTLDTQGLPFGDLTNTHSFEVAVGMQAFFSKYGEYHKKYYKKIHPRKVAENFQKEENIHAEIILELQNHGYDISTSERFIKLCLEEINPNYLFILGQEVSLKENRSYEFKSNKIELDKIPAVALKYVIGFLNSRIVIGGGQIFFGIEDSGIVSGIKLSRAELDSRSRQIGSKLIDNINPPISDNAFGIWPHSVYDGDQIIKDLYVLEVTVFHPKRNILYKNNQGEYYIRGDGWLSTLDPDKVTDEISRRGYRDEFEK